MDHFFHMVKTPKNDTTYYNFMDNQDVWIRIVTCITLLNRTLQISKAANARWNLPSTLQVPIITI